MSEVKFEDPIHLNIDGEVHEIELGDTEEVQGNPGVYQFQGFTFVGALRDRMNGGIYTMPPNTWTRHVTITGAVECEDRVIEGSGFTVANYQRDSFWKRLEVEPSSASATNVVSYGQLFTIGYKSTGEGLKLLGLYRPPFAEGMEVYIPDLEEEVARGLLEGTYLSMVQRIDSLYREV